MNYKERALYNSLLFEQIKSILIAEELNIKAIKESAKLEEELKNRKKGEIK